MYVLPICASNIADLMVCCCLGTMQLNSVRAFSVGPGAQGKASNAALPESGGTQVKQEYVFVTLFFFSALNTLYLWLCTCFYILIGICWI